ncbi:hypothetical protein UFOVP662_62 [uncultured Caudovirales phage]|uniref:Uncharacterized protein n=1 Tax=uncultured Caudovirales phage TaxID=2100421 RepID=A0A6J5QH77_9CAUD|nr:hypothetical protein UFOVP662_62 [uncultured Caudovirales phage]CAB4181706.1 hypothetical protein UFOVP1067_62 [uncultured Caudovirales phage]
MAIFNYQNIANLYSRVRTVFVERTTTTKDRTINIEAQNRTVYINDKPISFSRTVYT